MVEVTFVTPLATYHRWRRDAVAALVAAQTVPCRHIILIDEEGRGAGWARNQGLARVETPFVVFLDADDEISPRFVEACLSEYERWGGGRYIYTDWYEGDRYVPAPDCAWVDKTFHVVTTLLPTAWARAVGGFDEDLPGGEDTAFYLKLVGRGYCGARLNSPLFRYAGGGKRSNAFVRSARYSEIMAHIVKTYGGVMTCCGNNVPMNAAPGNEPQDGDVLAQALWGGNRVEFGRVTRRRYPRGGNGSLMYVAQEDIEQSPHLWARVETPAPVNPAVAKLGALFGAPPPRIIDENFKPQPAAPDLDAVLTRRKSRKLKVDFPSGQTIDGWNLDAWTMTVALEHMPKSGHVLTAGGGTLGFYAVEFDALGYKATVMEPHPQPELLNAIDGTDVTLISMAIGESSGQVAFYVNTTDPNVSSASAAHWGVYQHREISVQALSYADALKRIGAKALACLQLDIEGSEPDILPFVAEQPPKVLIYEFGGGDTKRTKSANWQPAHLEKAARAFELLRPHYTAGAIIDPVHKAVYEFKLSDVPPGGYAGLFHDDAGFGNVVLW